MLNLAFKVPLDAGTPFAVRASQRWVATKKLRGHRGLPATSPIYLVTRRSPAV